MRENKKHVALVRGQWTDPHNTLVARVEVARGVASIANERSSIAPSAEEGRPRRRGRAPIESRSMMARADGDDQAEVDGDVEIIEGAQRGMSEPASRSPESK